MNAINTPPFHKQSDSYPAQFLERAAQCIGADHVRGDYDQVKRYERNVTGISVDVTGIVRPGSTAEVASIVQLATELQQPIYTISQGKNWGMGSKCPAMPGCVVMDLSRLNQIREYHEKLHYVVIEPGVTQGHLYDFLQRHGGKHLFNATGSGRDTSILGNCLERGVGYFSSRSSSLTGLEVMLTDGSRINTGFGAFRHQAHTTHLYAPGVGPSLDNLFSQSNLGVVTAAGFRLLPAPEKRVTAVCKVRHARDLPTAIDLLKQLYDEGILSTSFHIANQARSHSTFAPCLYDVLAQNHPNWEDRQIRSQVHRIIQKELNSAWTIAGAIFGQGTVVRAQICRFRQIMSRIGDVRFTTQDSFESAKKILHHLHWLPGIREKIQFLEAAEPIFALTRGVPTDVALKSIHWPVNYPPQSDVLNPDAGAAGFLHCLPVLPLDGTQAYQATEAIQTILSRCKFEVYMTLNVLDGRALEGVINVVFDQNDTAQKQQAHKGIAEAINWCMDNGFPPYRLGNQSMQQAFSGFSTGYLECLSQLKDLLDPEHILSPGKYTTPDLFKT